MKKFIGCLEFKQKVNNNLETLTIKINGDFKHVREDNCVNHHDPIILFNHEVELLVERSKNEHPELLVIVDMKNCHYISSSGLANLSNAYSLILKNKGSFKIINIIDKLMSLFEETKIAEVIDCQSLKKIVKKPLI
jgi:anti-anti-sigma factor